MGTAKLLILTVTLLTVLPGNLLASGVGKAVAKGATRALARSSVRPAARRLASKSGGKLSWRTRLALEDKRRTKAVRLTQPRMVHRYTTLKQANLFRKEGIPPRTYFTSRARPGRPPSPSKAKQEYGLPREPHAVVKAEIPAGTLVKYNKVMYGARGKGQVRTHYKHLPPSSVKSVTRLNFHQR